MSNPQIKFKEIQKGDVIRAEWTFQDIQLTRVGKAESLWGGDWYTEMDAQLTQEYRDAVYYLIDRPKPPLPTSTGAVIIAHRVEGQWVMEVPMFLRPDCRWEYIDGTGKTESPRSIIEWKLAKVVEA